MVVGKTVFGLVQLGQTEPIVEIINLLLLHLFNFLLMFLLDAFDLLFLFFPQYWNKKSLAGCDLVPSCEAVMAPNLHRRTSLWHEGGVAQA